MSVNPVPDMSEEFINSGMTLITDPKSDRYLNQIREIAHDGEKFKKQNEFHERIRNDEDYDDWEYGTEPIYGQKWNKTLIDSN